jgi:transposase InsO family protein
VACGKRKVTRLMRQAGLEGRCKKRWRKTTGADPVAELARDLIQRHFGLCEELDHRHVGDITYVATWEGWAYLAVVDLASRRVVGWAQADYMRTELVEDALTMAFARRAPEEGVIFHSDRRRQANTRAVTSPSWPGPTAWSSRTAEVSGAVLAVGQLRSVRRCELIAYWEMVNDVCHLYGSPVSCLVRPPRGGEGCRPFSL